MIEFKVEYKQNDWQEWDSELVLAETKEEAIEWLKQHFIDFSGDIKVNQNIDFR